MPAVPDRFLSRPLLRQLAGEQLFASGEQCFALGGVRQIRAGKDRVSARVAGARTYRVKLWRRQGELQFRCDCDEGRTETFCQHCVAVGLAWLSHPEEPGAQTADANDGAVNSKRDEARREEERLQLAAHLRTFEPERLAGLLLEATDYDEILRRRLLLETFGIAPTPEARAATAPSRARPAVAAYRQLLREAIQPGGLVDYHSMPDYVQGIEEAIAPLAGWLRQGRNEEVIGLVEFAVVELDAAADRADTGDPLLNRVYDDLQRYHLAACRHAALDVRALAARLLHYELEGGLGIFNNAAKTYADLLGEEGQSAWRSLLIREWRGLAGSAASGAPSPLIDHRRFQVQMLMERLAEAEDDPVALLALKQADLQGVHDHVALSEWLESIGRPAEAVLGAEAASRQFTGPHEKRVWRDFLIGAYQRAGRHEAALPLAWEHFRETADLEHFRLLKSLVFAYDASLWPEWREQALAWMRADATDLASRATGALRAVGFDASRLVEILLDEKLGDAAWKTASAGGCRADLWLLLADHREREHPDDALAIYRRQIDRTLASTGPHVYREVVELLTRMRALWQRSGRQSEYDQCVSTLRSAHRKKRTFLRLLDGAGL